MLTKNEPLLGRVVEQAQLPRGQKIQLIQLIQLEQANIIYIHNT